MRLIIILSFFLLFIPPALAVEASTSQQLKETITDYPIDIQPLSKNAVLRVIMVPSQSFPKVLTLKNIQILDNNSILFDNGFIIDELPIKVEDYKILKGLTKDYLLYKLSKGPSAPSPDFYRVLYFNPNKQIHEAQGFVLVPEGSIEINNPKISEHVYQLIDDTYVLGTYWDRYCVFDSYFEIIEGKVYEPAYKNFKIRQYMNFADSNTFKKSLPKSIKIFIQPEQKEKYQQIIAIKIDTKLEILGLINTEPVFIEWTGVRYSKPVGLLHVRIDGKEAWMSEEYLGEN